MSFYDDASLIMYPSGYKEDKIYSLKPTDGSGDLTFTRASTATRVNADGLIETSPVNLFEYSQTFTNAYWTKPQASVVSGQPDPNGGITAFKLIEDTSTNFHWLLKSGPISSAGVWNVSIFAKPAGRNYIAIGNASLGEYAYFNLSNGTIISNHPNAVPTIEAVGNGYFRCSVALSVSDSSASGFFISTDGSTINHTGNGTSGLFLWGAQLNIGATAKPYFPTTDRLNVPRIDYTGGGCGKLLLEKQSTNLITYSEQFDNAAWGAPSNVIPNVTTSPDGTQNADNLIGLLSRNISFTAGVYALSFFAKKNTSSTFVMRIDIGGIKRANYNFDTQTTTNDGISSTMEDYGNGWFKCTFTFNAITATGVFYPNESASNLYIYGASLEAGSYVSSYIPTLASSVTRLADSASKTGISSLINSAEGVLYAELLTDDTNTYKFLSINDGTATGNQTRVTIGYFGTTLYANVRVANVYQFNGSITISPQVNNKIALKYKTNDFALWINGVEVLTDIDGTTFSTGTLTKLAFDDGAGASPFYGNVQNVMVFPSALSDTELATLTTL